MFVFFQDAAAFAAHLDSVGTPSEKGIPKQHPCIGTSCWSETEDAIVWKFLYMDDPAFQQLMQAWDGRPQCFECSSRKVATHLVAHKFRYGVGDNAPELKCDLPVRSCKDCGFEFVDYAGEAAREAAVRAYLNTLPGDAGRASGTELARVRSSAMNT